MRSVDRNVDKNIGIVGFDISLGHYDSLDLCVSKIKAGRFALSKQEICFSGANCFYPSSLVLFLQSSSLLFLQSSPLPPLPPDLQSSSCTKSSWIIIINQRI